MSGRGDAGPRLATDKVDPAYPPPAFLDEMELAEMEATRATAVEDLGEFVIEDPPHAVVELVHRTVPALIEEVRHLNRLLGRER